MNKIFMPTTTQFREANSQKADTVGKIFFNFLKMQVTCFIFHCFHHVEFVLQCMEKVFKPTKCTKSVDDRRTIEEVKGSFKREGSVGIEREGRHLNLGLAAVLGRSARQQRRCLEWEQEERWQIV